MKNSPLIFIYIVFDCWYVSPLLSKYFNVWCLWALLHGCWFRCSVIKIFFSCLYCSLIDSLIMASVYNIFEYNSMILPWKCPKFVLRSWSSVSSIDHLQIINYIDQQYLVRSNRFLTNLLPSCIFSVWRHSLLIHFVRHK